MIRSLLTLTLGAAISRSRSRVRVRALEVLLSQAVEAKVDAERMRDLAEADLAKARDMARFAVEERDAIAADLLKLESYLRERHPAEEWREGSAVDAAIRVMGDGPATQAKLEAIHQAAAPVVEHVKRWPGAPVTSAPGVLTLVSAVLATMPGYTAGARSVEGLAEDVKDASDERLDAAGGAR